MAYAKVLIQVILTVFLSILYSLNKLKWFVALQHFYMEAVPSVGLWHMIPLMPATCLQKMNMVVCVLQPLVIRHNRAKDLALPLLVNKTISMDYSPSPLVIKVQLAMEAVIVRKTMKQSLTYYLKDVGLLMIAIR